MRWHFGGLQARAADVQAAQGKATELNKENALLKRAVNILQTRLQDAANVNRQQAQQAEAVVSQLQVTTPYFSFELSAFTIISNC